MVECCDMPKSFSIVVPKISRSWKKSCNCAASLVGSEVLIFWTNSLPVRFISTEQVKSFPSRPLKRSSRTWTVWVNHPWLQIMVLLLGFMGEIEGNWDWWQKGYEKLHKSRRPKNDEMLNQRAFNPDTSAEHCSKLLFMAKERVGFAPSFHRRKQIFWARCHPKKPNRSGKTLP